MATSLHMLGKHHEALLVGIAGIQADEALRRDGELLTTLGLSQMALKKIREALLLWEKAAEADPAANDALLNMATVRIKQLDFEGAEALLRKVLDRDANNCAALYTLPVALRRLDKKDEALAMLEQATSTCKASVPAHFNRCVIAQALLSGSKKEVGQAKDICSASLAAVASGTPEHSELKKRVDGLTMAYEFMEDAPAAPATLAPPADGAAPAADEAAPAADEAAPSADEAAPTDGAAPTTDEAAPAAEAAPSEDAKPANDAPADAEPKPAQEEPPAAAEPTP
jgi:tetratricopeptide (TPR) repeat protein